MTDEYQKNSLLGQLEKNGILSSAGNSENAEDIMQFGLLTGLTSKDEAYEENISCSTPDDFLARESKIIKKRLNDFDVNIFQEGNILDIEDSELTTQEKIKKITFLIKKIDEKIFMLEDSDNEILMEKLYREKRNLENTLNLLKDNSIKNKSYGFIKLTAEKIKKVLIAVLKNCPLINKFYLVHHSLNKLTMLNESTKELISQKIPYGEQESRYDDFIAYLNCANVIHAKLKKKIR